MIRIYDTQYNMNEKEVLHKIISTGLSNHYKCANNCTDCPIYTLCNDIELASNYLKNSIEKSSKKC